MKLTISTLSGSPPIYKQIYEQVSAQIVSGELAGDTCLPPIRTLAKELRVSVIPVKQAWEELERAGLIYTMVGRGCFVAPLHSEELSTRRETMVFDKLMQQIEYCKQLGLTKEQLLEMIERCYD